MKSLFLTFVLLFSSLVFAAKNEVRQISANECQAKNTPFAYASIARPIKGTFVAGSNAVERLKALKADKETTTTVVADTFLNAVQKFSKNISFDQIIDAGYPSSNCIRSAQLTEVCEYDHGTKTVKCGQLCQFAFHCVDPR